MFRRWLSTVATEAAVADVPKIPRGIPRFWKTVTLGSSDAGTRVLLDGRPVRSPSGAALEIPSNKTLLALLVAGEWEAQKVSLKAYSLPLTSLVARGQDAFAGQGSGRQEAIDKLLKYLHTDAICYHQSFPESFVKLQEEHWMTILHWMNNEEKIVMRSTDGLLSARQPDATVSFFKSFMEQLPPLHLAAFERIVLSTKSVCIAYALYRRQIGVEFAAKAARLEALHQTEKWGEVEDAHDTDREDMKRQLGSAMALVV